MKRLLSWVGVSLMVAAAAGSCGGADGGGTTDPSTNGDLPAEVGSDVPAEAAPLDTADPGKDPTPAPDEGIIAPDIVQPDPVVTEAEDNGTPDVAPSCPLSAVTGPECNQAGACSLQCDDPAWQEKCRKDVPADVLEDLDNLNTCLAGLDGCTPLDSELFNEVFSQCARDGCGTEIANCFGGTGSCREVWICRKKCSADEPGCALKCLGIATPEEQVAWLEYVKCVFGVECAQVEQMPNGWPTQNCEDGEVWMSCALKREACIPPG